MSLAVEHLRDYLKRENLTQAEFAAACGYDASLVSNVLSRTPTVGLSARNVARLLLGIKPVDEKLRFIAAYLRDQIPSEHVHQVNVVVETGAAEGPAGRSDEASVVSIVIGHLFDELPMQTQTQVFHFVKALRRDPHLRKVFEGLMRYVPDDSHITQDTAATLANQTNAGTAGPFPVEILKRAQARKDAEAAQKRDESKSNPEPDTLPRSVPERKQVAPGTDKS